MVLAKWLWADVLRGQPLLEFLDNDAARFALISGTSPSRFSAELVAASAEADSRLGLFPWAARVPSWSNVADAPSRGSFEFLEALPGARRFEPVVPGSSEFSWEAVAQVLGSGGL